MIDVALPDYFARYPKPCMGGWGRRSLNVSPSGKVLPCHAAKTIPSLEFWSVRKHSIADIWQSSPAFSAFRGTDWMKEPCASCPRRFEDFGGCRCQALALTGDARATDPVCHLSSHHALMADLADQRDDAPYIPTASQRLKMLWWSVRSTPDENRLPEKLIAASFGLGITLACIRLGASFETSANG